MNTFLQEARTYARNIGQKNLQFAKEKGIEFCIGRLNISDGVQQLGYSSDSPEIHNCFSRFKNGDFGKQPPEDIEINKRAIESGYGDVMGEYELNGHKIWIKTDLNENITTTIFLPEEW